MPTYSLVFFVALSRLLWLLCTASSRNVVITKKNKKTARTAGHCTHSQMTSTVAWSGHDPFLFNRKGSWRLLIYMSTPCHCARKVVHFPLIHAKFQSETKLSLLFRESIQERNQFNPSKKPSLVPRHKYKSWEVNLQWSGLLLQLNFVCYDKTMKLIFRRSQSIKWATRI